MKLLFVLLSVLPCLASAQNLYFPPINDSNEWETIDPDTLGYCEEQIEELYSFLESNNTKAFVLLKDGKIVLEKYFDNHSATRPWYWASAGKTLISFAVGTAQESGLLNINDPTAEYLGAGWTNCTPEQENAITIKHQLQMSTGLDSDVADLNCKDPACLTYLAEPNSRWFYHNAPYLLLQDVLANASGMTLNRYLDQAILSKVGMSGSFLDVAGTTTFFSTARDMARFGLLNLNKGVWDGQTILGDTAYVSQMSNTSQDLNLSYGYLWWLNGKDSFILPGGTFTFPGTLIPNAPLDTYMALGKNGQFINVVPSENLVWIRMGDAPEELPVPYLLNDEIWASINDLVCDPLAVEEPLKDKEVLIFPNPARSIITIQSEELIAAVTVSAFDGLLRKQVQIDGKNGTIDVQDLVNGSYILQLQYENGMMESRKFTIAR